MSAARVMPGFRLSLGVTTGYLTAVVLLPLSALVLRAAGLGPGALLGAVASPRALAAFRLSFGAALGAAAFNAVAGLLLAWVLARYRFPGRALMDALIDLPFALPTSVAGIALTSLYAPNGAFGTALKERGLQVAFTPLGIGLALVFVGLPFVVRTVQPVLQELDPAVEEAAAVLGASPARTFLRVILPEVAPAALAGFGLAFARGLGEYGSVIFIAGNVPLKTEIVSLLIVGKLEQYDYGGATAIAVVMLTLSLGVLLAVNALQARLAPGGAR